MIVHQTTNLYFDTRLAAKLALGGTKGYNEALRRGELLFSDGSSIDKADKAFNNKTLSYHEKLKSES